MKKKMLVLLIGVMSLCSTNGTNLKKESKEKAAPFSKTGSMYALNPLFLIQ